MLAVHYTSNHKSPLDTAQVLLQYQDQLGRAAIFPGPFLPSHSPQHLSPSLSYAEHLSFAAAFPKLSLPMPTTHAAATTYAPITRMPSIRKDYEQLISSLSHKK